MWELSPLNTHAKVTFSPLMCNVQSPLHICGLTRAHTHTPVMFLLISLFYNQFEKKKEKKKVSTSCLQQEVENFKKLSVISQDEFDTLTPKVAVDPDQEVPSLPAAGELRRQARLPGVNVCGELTLDVAHCQCPARRKWLARCPKRCRNRPLPTSPGPRGHRAPQGARTPPRHRAFTP